MFRDVWIPYGKVYLEVFLHIIPLQWLREVFLVMTSAVMVADNLVPLYFVGATPVPWSVAADVYLLR